MDGGGGWGVCGILYTQHVTLVSETLGVLFGRFDCSFENLPDCELCWAGRVGIVSQRLITEIGVAGVESWRVRVKAAILAGGAGTRLYPITAYVPKTLLPIGNRYVIEYLIEYLKRNGINEIVMLISENEFELVRNHLGDGVKVRSESGVLRG